MDTFEREILLSVHKDMTVLKADMAETKVGLKEHMRRTAINEANSEHNRTQILSIQRQVWMVQGALAFVSFLALIAGIYKALV